jgi:protein unc-119
MILNPGATKSDTFYFVDGELIMHNKAEYDYASLVLQEE